MVQIWWQALRTLHQFPNRKECNVIKQMANYNRKVIARQGPQKSAQVLNRGLAAVCAAYGRKLKEV